MGLGSPALLPGGEAGGGYAENIGLQEELGGGLLGRDPIFQEVVKVNAGMTWGVGGRRLKELAEPTELVDVFEGVVAGVIGVEGDVVRIDLLEPGRGRFMPKGPGVVVGGDAAVVEVIVLDAGAELSGYPAAKVEVGMELPGPDRVKVGGYFGSRPGRVAALEEGPIFDGFAGSAGEGRPAEIFEILLGQEVGGGHRPSAGRQEGENRQRGCEPAVRGPEGRHG